MCFLLGKYFAKGLFKCRKSNTFALKGCNKFHDHSLHYQKRLIFCPDEKDFDKYICQFTGCVINCSCSNLYSLTCINNSPKSISDQYKKNSYVFWRSLNFQNFNTEQFFGLNFYDKIYYETLKINIFNGQFKTFDLLKTFPNVIFVNLTKNNIVFLNTKIDTIFKKIQILILNDNKLSFKTKIILPKTILRLKMSFSKINRLNEKLLKNLKNLQELNISFSKISNISSNFLESCKNLKYLSVKNVLFKKNQNKLNLYSFKSLKSLKYISIDIYKFCCFAKFYSSNVECSIKAKEFENCQRIIDKKILRGTNFYSFIVFH